MSAEKPLTANIQDEIISALQNNSEKMLNIEYSRDSKLFIKPLTDNESKRRCMVSIVPTIDGIQVAVSSGLRKEKQIVAKIKSASSFYYVAESGGPTTGTANALPSMI